MSEILGKAKNFLVEKVAQIPKPEADLLDVDLKDVSRDSVTFNSQLSVDNPYDHSIPICEISYSLKSHEQVIVSGTIPDPGSLKEKDKTLVDVPLKVPYGILYQLAKDIGSDWDIDYLLEVGLIIDLPIIGNFTIPLSKKGEFKLPTFADFF